MFRHCHCVSIEGWAYNAWKNMRPSWLLFPKIDMRRCTYSPRCGGYLRPHMSAKPYIHHSSHYGGWFLASLCSLRLIYWKPVGEEIWVGKGRELESQADLNHIHSQAGTETQLCRAYIMPGFMVVRLLLSWNSEITPLLIEQYIEIHCILQTASVMTHMCADDVRFETKPDNALIFTRYIICWTKS